MPRWSPTARVRRGPGADRLRRRDPAAPAAASQATVRQLITHTSGLGYWFWNGDLVQWEKLTGIPNVVAGLRASLRAPLVADPGTAFSYGISTEWLGQVVEAVTGVGLDVASSRASPARSA